METLASGSQRSGSGRTVVLLISGLPAVGKSTLVGELAPRLGAIALSRDRARLSAAGPMRLLDRVSFRLSQRRLPSVQRRASRVLIQDVERHLDAGGSVIVEALADVELCERVHQLAERHGAQFVHVECVCSDQLEYERRLAKRPRFWRKVVRGIAARHHPPPNHVRIDTVGAPREAASLIVAHLVSSTGPTER